MLPPGKNSGETTNESVVMASAAAVDGEDGLVFQRLEQRIAKGLEEDRTDQGLRGLAARAVRHGDAIFAQDGLAAAHPFDAFEHLLFGRLR